MVNVSSAIGRPALPSPSSRQRTRVGLPTVAGSISSQAKNFPFPASCPITSSAEAKQTIKRNKEAVTPALATGKGRVKTLPATTPKANSPSVNIPRRYHFSLFSLILRGKVLVAFPSVVTTSTTTRYSPRIGKKILPLRLTPHERQAH